MTSTKIAVADTSQPLSLPSIAVAGWQAVATYTGTMFAVFAMQTLLAGACLFAVAQVLASVFAYRPMFDDGVAGDLTSLVWAWRYGESAVLASGWLVLGVVLIWIIAGWFIAGGVAGVLLFRPQGRAATAKQFGASGVNTFFGFALLTVMASLVGVAILLVFATCVSWAYHSLTTALTTWQITWSLLLAFGPAFILTMVLWTVVDHARLELCLRRDTHQIGAFNAFFRATQFVVTHPKTLLWSLLSWSTWGLVGVLYAYLLTNSHPAGAWSLLMIRLGVSLLRMVVKFATLAGHAQWTLTRAKPPLTDNASTTA
jgi:hypothetical protein